MDYRERLAASLSREVEVNGMNMANAYARGCPWSVIEPTLIKFKESLARLQVLAAEPIHSHNPIK